MPKLPKLKIKWFVEPFRETTVDFEKAKHILPFGPPHTLSIYLGGQMVSSYDEFVQLATGKHQKNREFLEVIVIAPIGGG